MIHELMQVTSEMFDQEFGHMIEAVRPSLTWTHSASFIHITVMNVRSSKMAISVTNSIMEAMFTYAPEPFEPIFLHAAYAKHVFGKEANIVSISVMLVHRSADPELN